MCNGSLNSPGRGPGPRIPIGPGGPLGWNMGPPVKTRFYLAFYTNTGFTSCAKLDYMHWVKGINDYKICVVAEFSIFQFVHMESFNK